MSLAESRAISSDRKSTSATLAQLRDIAWGYFSGIMPRDVAQEYFSGTLLPRDISQGYCSGMLLRMWLKDLVS